MKSFPLITLTLRGTKVGGPVFCATMGNFSLLIFYSHHQHISADDLTASWLNKCISYCFLGIVWRRTVNNRDVHKI